MLRSRLASLGLPAAVALAGAAVAAFRIDRAAAPATLALALVAAAALAALAANDARPGWLVPGAGVAVVAALAFLPTGTPLPSAAAVAVLVTAIGGTLAGRLARDEARSVASLGGIVLAVELVARADRLVVSPLAPTLWAEIVVVTAAVSLALARLAPARPAAALALGLGTAAGAPGWGWTGAAAVVAGALAAERLARAGRPAAGAAVAVVAAALPAALAGPPWLALGLAATAGAVLHSGRAVARAGAATLAGAALAALAAGALPWCAERPLERVLAAALAPPFEIVAAPAAHGAVMLTAAAPHAALAMPGGATAARAVAIRSYLTDGAALPCGTTVAQVVLTAGGREVAAAPLVAGRDTADWAARRPDVAAAAACPAPAPLYSWLPATGSFLGSTYGARFELPAGVVADRVELRRASGLPGGVGVAVFWVGIGR